jgi:enamine deaminase RidA (YjgF/YER057c/UK114 family)
MDIEARLQELGYVLPDPAAPTNSYVHVRQVGNLLYMAGQGPKKEGRYPYLGKLGANVTLEQGQECARNCVVNLLGAAKHYLGDLARLKSAVKVVGYVASASDFTQQPAVMNAASDLLLAVMGEAGRHARTSIGVAVLPGDIPVEIEMILEIEG